MSPAFCVRPTLPSGRNLYGRGSRCSPMQPITRVVCTSGSTVMSRFLSQHWSAVARSRHIRPSSAAFRLLSHLPTAPTVTAESVQDALRTTDRTARNAISRLVDAGILVQRSAGRRNRVFECADMMDAFTESAREQPADALTLESSDAPHVEAGAVSAARSSAAAGTADSAQWLCNARTARGGACTHPRPKPGGCCPAGHEHPSPAPP